MQNVNVSIIIPVYNVEAYIIECLKSVTNQTYRGSIECLLIDDCGSDHSMQIAHDFIMNYYGPICFKIISHDYNKGLSAARNTGVKEAFGKYVFFLDSDDTIKNECIEHMMNVIQKHPEAELVIGGTIDIQGKPVYDLQDKNLPDFCNDLKWIKNSLLLSSLLPGNSCNKLLKRDFLIDNNIKQLEGIIHEDVPYCFHLAQKLKNIGICHFNTYIFRDFRPGSITTNFKEERSLQSRLTILNYCLDLVDNRYKDIQMRSLMLKCLTYLNMHQLDILQKYSREIEQITSRLTKEMPFPRKLLTGLYASLPLKIQHTLLCTKIFRKAFV